MSIEILIPNGNGDTNTFSTQFPASGSHYDKVITNDGNTTYVEQSYSATEKIELYTLSNRTGKGMIKSVVVHAVARRHHNNYYKFYIYVKSGGVTYQSPITGSNNDTYYDRSFDISALIDLNDTVINALQAGVRLIAGNSGCRLTQVYVEVVYASSPLPTFFRV